MWKWVLLAVLALAVAAQVPSLDEHNADQFFAQNRVAVVKFFAPWCGHCKAMAPEFVKLHAEADFAVAEVDCTTSESLCERYRVEGYPTVRLFVSGHYVEYEGERTAKGIAGWVQQFRGAQLKTLTGDELRELKSRETLVAAAGLSEEQVEVVKAASWIQRNTPFYLVSGDTAAVTLHLRGHPSIPYSLQDLAPSQLATWVFNQRRETVLRLTDSHNLLYLKNQKDFLDVLVLIDSARDESSDIFLSVHGYCQGEKASVLCATIPKDDPNFQQFEDSFNFKVEDHSVVLFRNRYQVGYVYPEGQAQTADDVRDFVEKARSDALPRAFDHFTKKHEVADIEYESVRMLDAGSYNSTLQENRFVLVEYYSPHCGHCTRFAKDYDRVAAQLSGEVVVAAVDASRERAIAALEGVKGYPTFKIFVGGEGVKYEGTRTAEAIVQFALEFARSRLLIVQKRKDLNLPAVAIGGIQVGSPLHCLPALYSRLPVYMVLDDEFSVEIHEESGVKRYEGEHSLIRIANWLEAETSPVLVSLGYPTPCPKLKKAMEDKLPILGLVIKGHHPANFALEFLELYCSEKSGIICGHISKGEPDYADMVQWLGDTDQDRNRLYIIQTDGLKKYAYPGSPATLVAAELDQWVADVLTGKLPAHDPAASPTEAQTAEQL